MAAPPFAGRFAVARETPTGQTVDYGRGWRGIPWSEKERRVLEDRPALLFAGEFEGHVDSKGRIAVPDAFTDALSGGAVVARGFERCVSVYSAEGWQRLAEEIGELPVTDAETRRLSRFIFASADEQEIDRQGRLELSVAVRRYAGVEREVVVIGAGNLIEIWDREAWAVELSVLETQAAVTGNLGNAAVNENIAA